MVAESMRDTGRISGEVDMAGYNPTRADAANVEIGSGLSASVVGRSNYHLQDPLTTDAHVGAVSCHPRKESCMNVLQRRTSL